MYVLWHFNQEMKIFYVKYMPDFFFNSWVWVSSWNLHHLKQATPTPAENREGKDGNTS